MSPPAPSRRRFLQGATATLLAGPFAARAAAPGPAADFDVFCRAIDEGYAFLERPADWKAARSRWRPRASTARNRAELIAALEGLIAELEDDHVGLDAHNPGSPRPVPLATDLWGEWVEGEARLSAVRAGSVADAVGLHPGQRIVTVGGVAVEAAVRARLPRARQSDPKARDFALRHLLAGPWDGALAIEARGASRGVRRYEVERSDAPPATTAPVIARRIGEDRDLGYLRVKNNLGDPGLVAHFDAALAYLKDTRGLLLDLRETQSGGSPAVAASILARFVKAEAPWILRVPRGAAAPAARRVAPRGPFAYEGIVAVLVDRWTAGEGESLAIGLAAVARATLVGTVMAGLRGELREVRLPGSGLVARFPGARVTHVNGTPREAVRPAVAVDLAAPSGGPGDPILYQGLKLLEGSRPGASRASAARS